MNEPKKTHRVPCWQNVNKEQASGFIGVTLSGDNFLPQPGTKLIATVVGKKS